VIPEAVVERAMKVQEVILRAMAKRITWWQAAEIIGISDRQMRDLRSGPGSLKKMAGAIADDPQRLTQVGRAMLQLGIRMIPAYSPQARGRSERNFGSWQGRLPQELRLRGITTVEQANRFMRQEYIAEFNRRFALAAVQPGSVFLPLAGHDLERIFAVQHERVVHGDNTVEFAHRVLQIAKTPWRNTLSGCSVVVYEHLDGPLSVGYGPHLVGRFNPEGVPLPRNTRRPNAVEKPVATPPWKTLRVSHFPTATAATRPLP
jgi:broad specificity phosphatase PhoE